MSFLATLAKGIPLDPLPPPQGSRDHSVPHAPVRNAPLSPEECKLAVRNALRYFPPEFHAVLGPEFAKELKDYGHIYMYRFRPTFPLRAYPITWYTAANLEGSAIMLMIMNNLDPAVAQFPHELVTYGGNGQVFSNWAQFWLVMKYLSELQPTGTLVINSGHPAGIYPNLNPDTSPRAVISNGMVIPNYSKPEDYDRMFALGVTMYGQMTAGSYCYIGPQGIVHGTTITIMNAARKYLGTNDLRGKVFLTSGLGGMSGAQAKAAIIAGCIGLVAEVSEEALDKRFSQKWVMEKFGNVDDVIERVKQARKLKLSTSIAYLGNIVTLWERFVEEYKKTGVLLVDLGSDQTSCHNPFNGGYYPVQLSLREAQKEMRKNPEKFKALVEESLRRQVKAINFLADQGLHFWDYGNAFLLQASRAGADVGQSDPTGAHGPQIKFRYPSYIQDILGDVFALGFGPYRWVCTSGDPKDLEITDEIAACLLQNLVADPQVDKDVRSQYADNLKWVLEAGRNKMVVGSQARILYSDRVGRMKLAQQFNEAIKSKEIKGPIVISRDHHDVSGTDSPFRETSNIYDGSAFTADMAIQNCIGDAFRGATWVSIHNGGGVGWGEVINGGFGLLLDGSEAAAKRAQFMLSWDVMNGVSRRSWAGSKLAQKACMTAMSQCSGMKITVPFEVEDDSVLTIDGI